MKRRKFVAGSAGLIASDLLSTSNASAQPSGVAPHRKSQLFTTATEGPSMQVQDLLFWNNLLYCLYFSLPSRYWGFSVTRTDGTLVWQCDLPKGKYSSIGIQNGTVILTAFSVPDSAGRNQANSVLQLDSTGSTALLQSLGPSLKGRFAFAGDSTFLR